MTHDERGERRAAMSTSTRVGGKDAVLGHRVPPGPRGRPLLGSMRDFQRDQLGFLREMALQYGDVVRYRIATMTWYQVNHPDGVRRILQENNHNYGKGSLTRGIFKPLIGEGLFISEGETWLRQRR